MKDVIPLSSAPSPLFLLRSLWLLGSFSAYVTFSLLLRSFLFRGFQLLDYNMCRCFFAFDFYPVWSSTKFCIYLFDYFFKQLFCPVLALMETPITWIFNIFIFYGSLRFCSHSHFSFLVFFNLDILYDLSSSLLSPSSVIYQYDIQPMWFLKKI